MRFLALALFAFAAIAADAPKPQPTAEEKLEVREAQLRATVAVAEMLAAQARVDKANAEVTAALTGLGKRLGCEIDWQTVACKPAAK